MSAEPGTEPITDAIDAAIRQQQAGGIVQANITNDLPPDEEAEDADPELNSVIPTEELHRIGAELIDQDERDELFAAYREHGDKIGPVRNADDARRAIEQLRVFAERDQLSRELDAADHESALADALGTLGTDDPDAPQQAMRELLAAAPEYAEIFAQAWDEEEPGAGQRTLHALQRQQQREKAESDQLTAMLERAAAEQRQSKALDSFRGMVREYLTANPAQARLVPLVDQLLADTGGVDGDTPEAAFQHVRQLFAGAAELERAETRKKEHVRFAATATDSVSDWLSIGGRPSRAEQEVALAASRPLNDFLDLGSLDPQPRKDFRAAFDEALADQENDPLRAEFRKIERAQIRQQAQKKKASP